MSRTVAGSCVGCGVGITASGLCERCIWRVTMAKRSGTNHTVAGPSLLTENEHYVIDLLAKCYVAYKETGVTGYDLREFVSIIHKAQHQVMAQAAARAYPDRYRMAEGTKT